MRNHEKAPDADPAFALESNVRWTAILLAGDRPGGDALAAHFGVQSKALLPVAGISMLRRVADTLLASPEIGRVVILAQDPDALMIGDAASLRDHPRIALAKSGSGISSSIARVAGSAIAPWPVLATTADNALLTEATLSEFLSSAAGCDVAVGLGERRNVEKSFPETRRTWLKFSDGHYSGANLFALRGPKAVSALNLWSDVEKDRKKGWKLMARFGPVLLLRAITRTIRLDEGLKRAGALLNLTAMAVVLSAPEAVIDVDKVDDFEIVEACLSLRAAGLQNDPLAGDAGGQSRA